MLDRILIVDDEPSIRQIIALVCNRLGFTDVQAEDNKAALLLAVQEKPAIVTTDQVRSGGSGIEFVKVMRRSENLAHIPIVMISGNASKADELSAWRAGITAFIRKPFGFDELSDTIIRLTRHVSSIDELLINLGREGRDLDYKQRIDFASKTARAELARDVIALANSGGGRLIIGVGEVATGFVQIGLPETELPEYETTRLNDRIRRYVGSTASLSTRIISQNGLFFVVAEVPPSTDTIALALENNQEAGLFKGRIYIRTQDGRTTELTDPLELQRLLLRLVDARLKQLRIIDNEVV